MSVCNSAWNISAPNLRIFMEFDDFGYFFRKFVEKIQVSLKSEKNTAYCTLRPICIFIIFRSIIFIMEIISDKVVEKFKTHFLWSITFFFRKSCRLWDNVEKRTDHRWQQANADCLLDTKGYKHVLRLCITACFSTATTVAWKRVTVRLCVYCVSC